jgi:uncharacterized protein YlxP (DUF503 family)
MFVGVARLVLQIPGARSLKDRRRVVKAFKDRVRARLPVSVAEVGDAERYQLATVGVAVVSGGSDRCREALDHARSLAAQVGDAVLADFRAEVMSFGEGGQGIRGGIEDVLDGAGSASDRDPCLDEDSDY